VVYNNVRYGGQPMNRVSYNGGRGGLNVQPRPAEVAAMRERHDAPMQVQRQARVEASQNRGQTFSVNHGRPSEASVQHGFANSRGIAAAPRGVEGARPSPEVRPGQPNTPYANEHGANAAHGQPYGNEPREENRGMQPQPNANSRFENRSQPQPNARFENHAQPQPQPRVETPHGGNRAMQPQPNAAQPRFENHAQPQPENRPQPQPRMENRAMPQQQHMEAPRPEGRPAQQPRQQGPPAQSHPAPQQPHGGGEHGGGNNGHQGGGEHGHR
jgi:hypothetical protein